MRKRTVALLLLFVILTWAGAAGIAYGVVQGAEGPQGEQGEQGPQGEKGERGPRGPEGIVPENVLPGVFGWVHPSVSVSQLARFWAVQQWSGILGENVTTTHPQVQACVEYILTLEGSGADCGFQLTE